MIPIVTDTNAAPRVKYGAERLMQTIESVGLHGAVGRIVVRTAPSDATQREGFTLKSTAGDTITITGHDDTGTLYGCLELAARLRQRGDLPTELDVTDAPAFVLRGPCIGMQKTFILPGRRVYEYPYTPELFPFFYDKSFWQEYLDFLADNRMNTLYLWNGEPFSSLVKLKDYPYALEVSDEIFQKNVQAYRYLVQEADRRGIWVLQNFYSIILPKPLADKHGLDTQLSAPTPVASDYMRKAIAEFVAQYPNVGLLICLGEALQGLDNQVFWCNDVILAGVKDGMEAAGIRAQPPVVIRAHATNPSVIMPKALEVYKNLYTMAKFNGESLTTWEPRGKRQEVHQLMSRLGSTHVSNVHILANLEPFRYGAARFIKKCVQASRDRLGARGTHLYPLAYWSWPDAPDKTAPPLKQWQRDWIWFEAWARYSWNPDVDETEDRQYWIDRLADMYGTQVAAGQILDAYNDAGECAPRLLRRFGITEGNRQTLSLGMTLDQLVNPEKYRTFPELWESQSPPGERLQEYVEREWNKQPHEGETPPQIVREVLEFSSSAIKSIESAALSVTKNHEEFMRLRNDIHCIRAMSRFYGAKATAAIHVLRFQHSKDPADMEKAARLLADSVEHYRMLAKLTADTYEFANTMQTNQRKIPVTGALAGKRAHYHWTQLVDLYEGELAEFRTRVERLKTGQGKDIDESQIARLPKAALTLLGGGAELYEVQIGAGVFTDEPLRIQSLAPELQGLTGIRISHEQAGQGKYVPVEFDAAEPLRILVGYFKGDAPRWLRVPDLETDAAAIDVMDVEPLIQNAATIPSLPAVDVYAFNFARGRHKLEVRGRGSFVVLGIVPQSATITRRDARRSGGAQTK